MTLNVKQPLNLILWPAGVFFCSSLLLQLNPAVALLLASIYMYALRRGQGLKNFNKLYSSLLLAIAYVSSFFMLKSGLSFIYIPLTLVPILVQLLFGSLELSLLFTLCAAVLTASLTATPFNCFVIFLTSGIAAALLTRGARKRSTLIRAGLIIGLIQSAALILSEKFSFREPLRYLIFTLNGIASAGLSIIALPIFEYLFKTVTSISLLELADFSHPLLQRLNLEAPGTYHHSLIVGNLSESACAQIGANALLARLGAYYHDIGKLHKPDYFSENQTLEASKHESLTPSMSKLLIMNHVNEGLELARKYRLKPAILDFIRQHHGNSLVYYFYRRAIENLEEDQEIKEEGFRYPGPKPNTRETAVVLLADSVEAATRALKDPTPQRIEEVVHKIINNKFIDGQLDDCELTLKDLEKIASVFIRILGGIYHARVEYPQKPAQDPAQPQKAKKVIP